MIRRLALILSVATLTTACGSDDPAGPPPDWCGEMQNGYPIAMNRDLDILFVIDNSASMADEQTSLLANFPRFAAILDSIDNGRPNLHIGVVTTDVGVGSWTVPGCTATGDDGRMRGDLSTACAGLTDSYLIDVANPDGTRTTNYPGTLADAFACIAAVGTDGCDFGQPLEALRRALPGDYTENAGFLRPDAFLFVVFLTDGDDCSVAEDSLFDPDDAELGALSSFRCFEHGVVCSPDQPTTAGVHEGCVPRDDSPYFAPIAEYVQFLRGLKADPNMVLVAAAFGDPSSVTVTVDQEIPALAPACVSASGQAEPAIRLSYFLDQFVQRNSSSSICNEDLSDALEIFTGIITYPLLLRCLEGSIDLDPDMPGLQVDCTVSDFTDYGTSDEVETIVPPCPIVPPPPGTLPCWTIAEDPNCSETETQAVIEVHRSSANIPNGSFNLMRCFTGCTSDDIGPTD